MCLRSWAGVVGFAPGSELSLSICAFPPIFFILLAFSLSSSFYVSFPFFFPFISLFVEALYVDVNKCNRHLARSLDEI